MEKNIIFVLKLPQQILNKKCCIITKYIMEIMYLAYTSPQMHLCMQWNLDEKNS